MKVYDHGSIQLYHGEVLDELRTLRDGCVQCVVTSPPYWGLRDYGTAAWEGGDPACDHRHPNERRQIPHGDGRERDSYATERVAIPGAGALYRDTCGKCGAVRTDRQLGLEDTPEEYIARLVDIFREVRRVLREDGTLWLNLGDSYCSTDKWGGGTNGNTPNIKPKDLVGIPWRVALALQADGWWLRSDIIWSKGACMPESVQDRPTRSHEYIFLLTKSADYFYDADAVREPFAESTLAGKPTRERKVGSAFRDGVAGRTEQTGGKVVMPYAGRNRRTVWHVNPTPTPAAHFATYPTKLVEPCILAGTSERGACGVCGMPWTRVVSKERMYHHTTTEAGKSKDGPYASQTGAGAGTHDIRHGALSARTTTGWEPSCGHTDAKRLQCVVLDPFAGSGTTLLVAKELGRAGIGIDLKREYLAIAEKRLQQGVFNFG